MGIADTRKDLPANRMIFEVRRDRAKFAGFADRLEDLMEEYGLSEEERQAFRDRDLGRLGTLGVHPYFLPQVSRLFHGTAYNHNRSRAARAYGRSVVGAHAARD